MNNFVIRLKRFFTNKNVVTVIGVLLVLVILFYGYSSSIKKQTNPINLPVAAKTINAQTQITNEDITYVQVANSMVGEGVIRASGLIIGKYTNLNVTVPKGSVFYSDWLVEEDELPGNWIEQLDYENYLMKFRAIDAIFGTIAPLFTSLLIACRLRKEALTGLAIASVMKLVTLYPCVQIFGMTGSTFSNLCYYLAIIGFDLYWINKKFHIRWKYTLRKLLVMLGALIITSSVYLIMSLIFGDLTRFGRIGLIPFTALEGIIVMVVYIGLTGLFQLPQQIFKIDLNTIIRKLRRK